MTPIQKTVLLTGAAGNLGRAVAQMFAHDGANLVLLDRSPLSDTALAALEPALCLPIALDLCDAAQVLAAVDQAIARFGRVDVLCNLTGGFAMGQTVHETSDSAWDVMQDINVLTLRNTARAVVPQMLLQGGGKIVNVGAYSAQRGLAGMGAYIAAKSEVLRITEAMSAELRMKNINVNCVTPGAFPSAKTRENAAFIAELTALNPLKRIGRPDDLIGAFIFLSSAASDYVTGHNLVVDGGWTAW